MHRRAFSAGVMACSLVGCGASAVAQTAAPSATLAADLSSLREEEKLARDTYRTLGERWGLVAFRNIAEAEQRHFDRVGSLLAQLGLADPALDDAVGTFTDPRFASLYAELVERGSRSELDALQVGALIEELDIADLDAMQLRTRDADAIRVYELLRCGSRNHLRAFDGLLAARGASYQPIHLPVERYREIARGEHERCGGGGMGGGPGSGRGRGRRGGF